jgi:hypothetical protein
VENGKFNFFIHFQFSIFNFQLKKGGVLRCGTGTPFRFRRTVQGRSLAFNCDVASRYAEQGAQRLKAFYNPAQGNALGFERDGIRPERAA